VYWPNLATYVEALDKAGKLVRVTTPVNKDTELHPLVRLQFRGLPESQRKAFFFDNIHDSTGRKHDIPVLVGALAGTADIYAMGMGCKIEEIPEVWNKALANPIMPKEVSKAACQEVVITGEELKRPGGGLGRLPIPISTPGFDNAPYTSASHWVTKDPDQGIHNLGNYRGMVKAEDRIGAAPGMVGVGMRDHIDRWREKGAKSMPAAIVIGAPPHVTYTAVTRIPNDVCEYDVAGGMSGNAVEVVKCVTQDLMVPAEAEIVIEGVMPVDTLEMEGSFGEFPGYMAQRDYSVYMDVTAITMRKKPIYLAILSQMPPSESSKMRHIGRNATSLKLLHDNGFTNVKQVAYLECGGSNALVVVKMKKRHDNDAKDALRLLAKKFIGKITIAVDEDVNITDTEMVLWAIAFRSQPYRDCEIVDAPLFSLDPSTAPPTESRGLFSNNPARSTALLIDATLPWGYPPISLPRKQFMDRAVEMWRDLQLPTLALKDPWWGYTLGAWTDEEEEEAQLAVKGEHYTTGEKQAATRLPFDALLKRRVDL
jgi:UbiD family decarboxylase